MGDKLQVHNWIRRYESLNTKALDKRTELIKIERDLSKCFATSLPILRDMHDHLKAKPICDETKDYPSVQAWIEDWAKPFLHLETSQVYYMIGVAHHLLNKVTTEEIESMGIENAKTLSGLARSKGRVGKEMVNKAISMGVMEFKEEVRKLLYGSNPDHHEGEWVNFLVRGPQEYIDDIKEFLTITRRQEGNGPSDAELIALVLKPETIVIVEAEAERRKQISGVASIHREEA